MPNNLRRSKRIAKNEEEQRHRFTKIYKKTTVPLKKTAKKKGPTLTKLQALHTLILSQINQTRHDWDPPQEMRVMIDSIPKNTTTIQRQRIQDLGNMYGCHECGSFLHLDSNQPWVGDHIPSTNLSNSAKRILGCPDTTYLFPSCDSCSHEQAQLVKRLNSNPTMKLSRKERKLIYGTWDTKYGVKSTGPTVTPTQGKAIQRLGEKYGCHICDTRMPVSKYDADHAFPKEFCTHYMQQVFLALKIPYPEEFELRPHCTRCSRKQGGGMGNVRNQTVLMARGSGLVVHK